MQDHHHHALFVVFFSSCAVVVLGVFLVFSPRITGEAVVARDGVVTRLDVVVERSPSSWLGVFGDLTPSAGNVTYDLPGGQVMELNLSYAGEVTGETLVVASTTCTPDWHNLSPASHADVDSFLGLSPGDEFSSQGTLLALVNFTIDDVVYELWSAVTRSVSGDYQTGVLVSGGDLLLVTRPVVGGLGFDGQPVMYQLLLPVDGSGSVNYTFFVFEQSVLPGGEGFSCDIPINLTAYLAEDDRSVTLEWDPVPGAVSYDLLYVDGATEGEFNFSSPFVVPMGGATRWTDAHPSDQRYYRVSVWNGSVSCVSDVTAGTLLLGLSPDFNMFSTPFVAENASVEEALRSIGGNYSSAYEFNNTAKGYNFYLVVGQNIFKNFDTITPGRGYWVNVKSDSSLRLAGRVKENVTAALSPDFNLLGFPVISNDDADETVRYVLSSIDGEYSSAYEFNNTAKGYNFYLVVGQNIFKNFDTITPGRGYWVNVKSDVFLEYQND